MREKYIGSIRFYKNLILLAVVLAIGISAGFAIHYGRAYRAAEKSLAEVSGGAISPDKTFGQVWDGAPAYQSLYPDFYASRPYEAQTRDSGVVYLTFEGGPSACTDEILMALDENDVKATFFVSGASSGEKAYDARLQAIVDGGHTLGMLSWSSDYLTIYHSVEDYLADMYSLFAHIKDVTGTTPTVFRFRGGSINAYNTDIYQQLLAEMIRRGFVPCDWNISCSDAVQLSPSELTERVLSDVSTLDRAVIRLYDEEGKELTAKALPDMIAGLRETGVRLAPLTPQTKPVIFAYPQ